MKILQVKASVTQDLMAISGVVGVGIQKGKIVVYTKKTTKAILSAIPLTIEGYGVKIIEIGEIFAFQDRTDKWRPAPGGVSIGHPSITAGTLGVVVRDNANGRRVILSNNHVLANSDSIQHSRASFWDEIYQPGSYDGGTLEDTIANLERWVKIDEVGTNIVDCAIATPINDEDIDDEILEIGIINGISEAIERMSVRKSGRTTELTIGSLVDVNMTIDVNYGNFIARFEDCILTTENMADGGDSGSLVVDLDNKAVGLLFAGGANGISVSCKCSNVANMLNVNFGALVATTHDLKLMKEGYYDHEENFTITEGETKDFNINLTPIEEPPPEKSYINVNSIPLGANIYLNDNYIGQTNSSYEIDAGTHTLKLTLEGYYDYTENFTITEGETKDFNITLEEIPPPPPEKATLIVNTIPVLGGVFVNNESWGVAPQTREVDVGTYTISFGNVEDYETPEPTEITLADGEIREIIGEYVEIPSPEEKKFPYWTLLGIPLLIPLLKKKRKKK